MISTELVIVIVNALVAMLFVWAAARRLVQDRSPITEAFPGMDLQKVLRGLLIATLGLTALFAVASYILHPEGDGYARATQAVFLLGWWSTIVLLIFVIFVGIRSSAPVPASAVVGLLISLPPLILFTSMPRFTQVFSGNGYDRALIIGLALGTMGYTIFRRLGRAEPAE